MIEISGAGTQIEALVIEPLLEPMLAPLADAMGEFGSLVAEMCATRSPESGSASLRISSIRPRVAMVA